MLLVSDIEETGGVSWLLLEGGPEPRRDPELLRPPIGEETRCGEGLRLVIGGALG
jgi:hypothetical protein